MEANTEAEAAPVPEEAGGEGSASLFDFTGDARVRMLRKDERTQKFVSHGFFPTTVQEEDVQAEFGGGHYRAQLLIPDPATGLQQIKRQRDFHLLGPYKEPRGDLPGIGPRDPTRAQPAAQQQNSPSAPAAPGMQDIMSAGVLQLFQASAAQQQMMLQMFSAAQQQQSALLQAIMNRPAGPDVTAILTAATPLLQEFFKRPKEERDPLEMLRTVGEIVKNNSAPSNQIAETLGAIREIIELKNDITPGGTGDPLMDSLPKITEVLWEGWQQQKQHGKPVAANPPTALPPVTPTPEQQNVPLWKLVFKKEGTRLVQAAAAGKKPEAIATIAVEFAPENVKGSLAEFFHRETPEVLEQLVQEVPGLSQYPNWALDFVTAVQDIMFPGEYDEEDSPDEVNADDEETERDGGA